MNHVFKDEKIGKKIIFIIFLAFACIFFHPAAFAFSITANQEPSFEAPVSQLATENQFYSPQFHFWCKELHEPFKFHRKLWEYCYVAQVAYYFDMLKPGKKALGFGVGTEPLPALFAKCGVQVVASDQDFDNAKIQGWVLTGQFSLEKSKLNSRNICDPDQFDKLVTLNSVDMNNVDKNLNDFDFVWSCCSLEHLGNLRNGLDFIINSMKCLKPGGIAIHTTEYNLSSNTHTIESGPTVIYRKRDMIRLARELIKLGYQVIDINCHCGNGPVDKFIDLPPYKQDPHIKLRINDYDCTSFGIIVKKP